MALALPDVLRLDDTALWLLDQRALPGTVAEVPCRSAAETAAAIKAMIVRGAPAIGLAAAYGMAVEARRLVRLGEPLKSGLAAAERALAESRPTAVNLVWALDALRPLWQEASGGPEAIAGGLAERARALHDADVSANRRIGAHGQALFEDGMNVLTHCNAGALATGGFGTALGLVYAAVEAGKRLHVWVDETRPVLQGARLTAWELGRAGVPCTLIADNMAASLMAAGKVDAVVVGADRIASNGDTANKIGTYGVAVLAAAHGIPFYVAAPTSTIDPAMPDGGGIVIEQREPDEVRRIGGMLVAPAEVAVHNPSFDVTPARLIAAIVTEAGIHRAPYAFGDLPAASAALSRRG